ncbi:MAG TPA: ATP-binding cassette domain-containing protein [Actinocrinis sp.]|nr:ATP-binding cassette domain-containing protein [Actinocrinis sp.]
MIEVIDLTVRRRGRIVLDEVSFDIRPGQVTGLLGAGGAGKTAVVRQLVRLDRGRGRVLYDGVPYRSLRHPSSEVGLLLDPGIGDPRRTVRGQLRLLLAADRQAAIAAADPGLRRRERAERRLDEVLGVVGLIEQGGWRLGELSDEMATRLAVGAALLADPKTLVLDDPGAGLEPDGLAWLGALLRAFTGQGRAALVTGSRTEPMVAMADRILLLDAGQLVGIRTAEEVLRAPAGAVVVVRSPQIVRFADVLSAAGARTAMGESGCLEVRGMDRAGVGEMAYRHGVPVYELAERFTGSDPADLVLAGCSAQYRDARRPISQAGPGQYREGWRGSIVDAPDLRPANRPAAVRLVSVPEHAPESVPAQHGSADHHGSAEHEHEHDASQPSAASATATSDTGTVRPMFGSEQLRRTPFTFAPEGDGYDWPESVRLVPTPDVPTEKSPKTTLPTAEHTTTRPLWNSESEPKPESEPKQDSDSGPESVRPLFRSERIRQAVSLTCDKDSDISPGEPVPSARPESDKATDNQNEVFSFSTRESPDSADSFHDLDSLEDDSPLIESAYAAFTDAFSTHAPPSFGSSARTAALHIPAAHTEVDLGPSALGPSDSAVLTGEPSQ